MKENSWVKVSIGCILAMGIVIPLIVYFSSGGSFGEMAGGGFSFAPVLGYLFGGVILLVLGGGILRAFLCSRFLLGWILILFLAGSFWPLLLLI